MFPQKLFLKIFINCSRDSSGSLSTSFSQIPPELHPRVLPDVLAKAPPGFLSLRILTNILIGNLSRFFRNNLPQVLLKILPDVSAGIQKGFVEEFSSGVPLQIPSDSSRNLRKTLGITPCVSTKCLEKLCQGYPRRIN